MSFSYALNNTTTTSPPYHVSAPVERLEVDKRLTAAGPSDAARGGESLFSRIQKTLEDCYVHA